MTDPYLAQLARRLYPGALGGRSVSVTPIDVRSGQHRAKKGQHYCKTFAYTGAVQTWDVPPHTGLVQIIATGAPAGTGSDGSAFIVGGAPGLGRPRRVSAAFTITAGSTLDIYVGEIAETTAGGWPDGGTGYSTGLEHSRGGSGSTRVEQSGTILVQAGAAGGDATFDFGGGLFIVSGGGEIGGYGYDGSSGFEVRGNPGTPGGNPASGGNSATPSAAGTAGQDWDTSTGYVAATDGASQQGGNGGGGTANAGGGGGGGGFYGGGGGGNRGPGAVISGLDPGGGGQGSSHIDGAGTATTDVEVIATAATVTICWTT